MLRIVGVQRNERAEQEFVLLQNQGSLRLVLRGHMILADCALTHAELGEVSHLFVEDEPVHPGLYVLLSTGPGISYWGRTKDGAHVFHAYAGRARPLWHGCEGPLHVLSPCHTFSERPETLMLR
jgi:hypothetical protein